ncbi:MAG TPA: hypothetical protein VI589_10005 [Vicinamibacteria bacterium]
MDGWAALQWTRHLCARNAEAPRVTDARPAGRWAARAVDGLAPLPPAWEAARLAHEFGRRLQPNDAAAARALLSQVRESLERAESSPWRRIGLGGLKDEVWQAENSLLVGPDGQGTPR